MTLTEIRAEAKRLGLYVEEQSPGDGARRYRFITARPRAERSRSMKGARIAEAWLEGFAAAQALNEGKP